MSEKKNVNLQDEFLKSQIRMNNANAENIEIYNNERKEDGKKTVDTIKIPLEEQIKPPSKKSLVSFESGHYKEINGRWKGDSVWCHFYKESGGMVHINKDKVEYIEDFE
jgi:hypothetical protein